MIISASYRTDIPAFYGRWFMNRLDAGYCRVVNPYGRQTHRIDLTPAAVDGFVFWTRNIEPFLGSLDTVAGRGFPFVVQYTVTGYPRALERSVPAAGRSVAHLRHIRDRFGPRAGVWRYDPVALSSLTPPDWHAGHFAGLAKLLRGAVDEVIVSFMQAYRKTRRNLDRAARAQGFTWHDPAADEKRALLDRLTAIAGDHGMALTLCTQPGLPGVPARCIDAVRLSDVAGRPIRARTRGNRPGCACGESRDIGGYDSCPHGCVYCYAVATRAAARRRLLDHDPEGEFLIGA